jgi:hypothetical protein
MTSMYVYLVDRCASLLLCMLFSLGKLFKQAFPFIIWIRNANMNILIREISSRKEVECEIRRSVHAQCATSAAIIICSTWAPRERAAHGNGLGWLRNPILTSTSGTTPSHSESQTYSDQWERLRPRLQGEGYNAASGMALEGSQDEKAGDAASNVGCEAGHDEDRHGLR